ncbi:MAG: glutamine amidotransferase [Actinomycetaceae bacterium]|nr:glutamine amidotransferase [Actinomycetaceae bacterium]
MTESTIRIGVVLPEVLGTYGDGGNAVVLQKRLEWRGISSEVVSIGLGQPVPSDLDIYLLGGGEDAAQGLATENLRANPGLQQAAGRGATVLAICAGMQILGEWYTDASGNHVAGLGVLDARTFPQGKRSTGELVSTPLVPGLTDLLTGFENHGGATELGPDARPLGRVLHGDGNAVGDPLSDGAVQGGIFGTYMHGPALARNPQFADFLIMRASGLDSLQPLDLPTVDKLRGERLDAAGISIGAE